MHKSDIERLEDMLINQDKYKQQLRLREMELEDTVKETIPASHQNNELQDPRTIRAGSNTSSVESKVLKCHNDLRYQTLYSIVHNTPKFISGLTAYERIIYDYRYKKINPIITEWDDIAELVEKEAMKRENPDVTVGRTKTLNIRVTMLKKMAEYIGYTLM